MTFTIPPTFVAGNQFDAADLNQYVRDNFKALGDAWQSYTPTIGGWTLVNGTLVGKYMQTGKLVIGRVEYTVGASDTKAGTITITPPVTPNLVNGQADGCSSLIDTSAAIRNYRHVFWGSAGSVLYQTTESDVRVTSTVPWTWATGDQMLLEFEYEAL